MKYSYVCNITLDLYIPKAKLNISTSCHDERGQVDFTRVDVDDGHYTTRTMRLTLPA